MKFITRNNSVQLLHGKASNRMQILHQQTNLFLLIVFEGAADCIVKLSFPIKV